MQLTPLARPGPAPDDVATALRVGASKLGHRPAVTQLLASGRQEQSVASLAQWAAKGAHFLDLELGLTAGDRIHLAAPLGWTTAAVALAAWWGGIAVSLTPEPDIEVAVLHASRNAHVDLVALERFWLGDGIDGAPTTEAMPTGGEPWAHAVQPFPDQPPIPRAAAGAVAVIDGARITTQAELLELAANVGGTDALGLDRPEGLDPGTPTDATLDLALLCLRPLLSGRPTVVLRDVSRSTADGERVGRWH